MMTVYSSYSSRLSERLPTLGDKDSVEVNAPLMWVDLFVLAFCLIFMQLPKLVEVHGIAKLSILPFLFVIFKNLLFAPTSSLRCSNAINKRFREITSGNNILSITLLLALVLVIADFRSFFAEITLFVDVFGNIARYALLFVFILSVWLTTPNKSINTVILALLMSPALLVLLNLALFSAGVRNQITGSGNVWASLEQSRLLSIFGITAFRTVFPLTSGVNGFGSLTGLVIVLAVLGIKFSKSKIWQLFHFVSLFVGLVAVAMVDSRGALVSAIVTLIFILKFPKIVYRHALLFIIVSGVLPFLILPVLSLLPIGNIVNLISRHSSVDAGHALFTARTLIWAPAWKELIDISPLHFIGFGTRGQAISGVSTYYGYLIAIRKDALMVHLHNFDLQTIFDIGYFGLALYFVLLSKILVTCRDIDGEKGSISYIFLAIFVYGGLQGATEAMPSIAYEEMYWLYTVLIIFLSLGAPIFHKKILSTKSNGEPIY